MFRIRNVSQACLAAWALMFIAPAANATPFKVLYTFCSQENCVDGSHAAGSVIADSAGNLYGTTAGGGASGAGTVFKLAPDGTETVLLSFSGGSDGGYPQAGLPMTARKPFCMPSPQATALFPRRTSFTCITEFTALRLTSQMPSLVPYSV